MAESVDALVSNTSGATRAGSTPARYFLKSFKISQDAVNKQLARFSLLYRVLICSTFAPQVHSCRYVILLCLIIYLKYHQIKDFHSFHLLLFL